jgi:hypothetical protein
MPGWVGSGVLMPLPGAVVVLVDMVVGVAVSDVTVDVIVDDDSDGEDSGASRTSTQYDVRAVSPSQSGPEIDGFWQS